MQLIRLATQHDIKSIFDIRISVKENHLSLEQLTEMGITPISVLAMMESEPCIWVVEKAGMVLGFSIVDFKAGMVFASFVHPDHEGNGFGKQLMKEAEALLFQKYNRIYLETDSKSRAYQFYKHLGWNTVEFYANGDVKMEKLKP